MKRIVKNKSILFILTASLVFLFNTFAFSQEKSAMTIRDFFMLIPSEYFNVACCEGDKNEFIKKYVTVEDASNGYMEGEDTEEDPKYAGFKMALFKRANGKHIIGLHSYSLNWSDYYFLEYTNSKLKNISLSIPQYSLDNIYDFPRKGTTIQVFRKKYDSPTKELNVDNGVSKGRKLYDLIWQKGKFVISKKK